MKKLLSLALAVIMLFSIAACSVVLPKDDTDLRGEITSEGSDKQDNTSSDEQETAAAVGSTSGSKWENKAIGLGFNLPENWKFSTQDELEALGGADYDNENIEKALENAQIFFDMQATAQDLSGNSINVVFEKLAINALTIDEDGYIDSALPQIKTQFESMGASNVVSKKTTVNIGDKTYKAISNEYEAQGNKIYQYQIIVKLSKHMAVITVTSAVTDSSADIIKNLYNL